MQEAIVRAYLDEPVATIDPRIYSGFIEHLGRGIYGGIYEPEHPSADVNGFRGDVADALRSLRMPLMRYPGGNFVSSYLWEEGVGPREERPVRLDLAWRSLEPNLVGTNEFMDWVKLIDSQPMLAVNLGTRGLDAACDLLEYCNHPSGTKWSDLRRSHGYEQPHKVPVWCLGNEMDGPWQIGQRPARDYGILAAEAAKAMRLIDPTIELVACGSSGPRMATFPDWEESVLDSTYNSVDYISLHIYLRDEVGLQDLMVQSVEMDEQIRTVIAACDLVKARKRSSKTMMLSFDEWNVWYHNRETDKAIMRDRPWQIAPPVAEESYTAADAIAVGSMLLTLLRHAERVRMACIAQVVNVLAPLMTETGGRMWKQTTWYPLEHASRFGRGEVVFATESGPDIDSERYGPQPAIESIVTRDPENGTATLFSINRSMDAAVPMSASMNSSRKLRLDQALRLQAIEPSLVNTAGEPDRVVPVPISDATFSDNRLGVVLPPLSWNVFRFAENGS
jgi:alpha-N-arabinofuranosidase